jgi:uncharacterized protein YgbK (DUF1537 family)
MTLTLIADDLTGACDAGALFAGRGSVTVPVDAAHVDEARPVVAVDTDSRSCPSDDARRRVAAVAHALAPRLPRGRLFKKLDSTLRGHAGAEIETLLAVSRRARALVAPAFPAESRVVVEGRLLVGGRPVHETAFGRDPAFPRATSAVVDLLGAGASLRVATLRLDTVRRGPRAVADAIITAGAEVIAADAETDADLDSLASAAEDPTLVLAGSAGLARALAARLGLLAAPPPLPEGRAWLIVAGSRHPATRAQVGALAAAGIEPLRVAEEAPDVARVVGAITEGRPAVLASADAGPDDARSRARMAQDLGSAAAHVLDRCRPDLVVVAGGETARALLVALGAHRIDLTGAPESGLALGDVAVPAGWALPLMTKAGGFGRPDQLLALVKGHP